jgi:uncharacterized protein YbjT (DUF2867 family)
MHTKTIVVTGASGQIGRALSRRLLERGHIVRVVARTRERLAPLGARGAEVHAGSVEDGAFLERVLRGADSAFLMVPPDYGSNEILANQRRVVDAEVAAVRASGVRRVVALSSIGAHLDSGTGPIVTLRYLEQQLSDVEGVDVLFLRAAYFMENLLQNIDLIKGMGIAGSGARADASLPMVTTPDIAEVAAERLERGDFAGKVVRYVLGARDVTFGEAARILGASIGRPDLPYVQFSYDDLTGALTGAGLPPKVAGLFVEMNRAINDGLLAPTQARTAENTTPTTLEAWSSEFASAFAAGAAAAHA